VLRMLVICCESKHVTVALVVQYLVSTDAYCIINALHTFMSHLSTLVGIFNALFTVQNTDIALAAVLCNIVQIPSLKVTM